MRIGDRGFLRIGRCELYTLLVGREYVEEVVFGLSVARVLGVFSAEAVVYWVEGVRSWR